MPGATLDSVDGDEIRGRIKVKVGPISMTYAGTAKFIERDADAGVVTLEASGKETKGAGTASASVRSVLEDRGSETHITVHTTLNVTGKPAQFGRGVLNEVGGKLIDIFATNLAATLAESNGDAAGATEAEPADSEPHPAGTEAVTSIDELKLQARAASTLHREGLTTIADLAAKTGEELLAIDGIGPATVTEITAKLAERGLTLGQPGPQDAKTATSAEASAASSQGAAEARPAAPEAADESINLLKVAGLPMLKRALPVLAAATAALLIGLGRRMRKRRRRG
jgi:carbon monoxide dehydrogenase subunit G